MKKHYRNTNKETIISYSDQMLLMDDWIITELRQLGKQRSRQKLSDNVVQQHFQHDKISP